MKNKTQVSISIEIELRQKLDLYAKDTRRNRSQAVETLIAEYSIDKASVINTQAKKIKELESELILLKSDKVILPEFDQELIQRNTVLEADNRRMCLLLEGAAELEDGLKLKLSSLKGVLKEIEEHAKNNQ
jgi:metal-responsive CopG/Arc/MetJ family transcriptional regulator